MLLGCQPAPSADASRFDLVCRFAPADFDQRLTGPERSTRFSIDLTDRVWCEGDDCREGVRHPIQEIEDGQIVLYEESADRLVDETITIDRTTGEFGGADANAARLGRCERAAFTPMPQREF